jgi:hypothetical protein
VKKLLLLLTVITAFTFIGQAQAKIDREEGSGNLADGTPVFQGQLKVTSLGYKLSYAFDKGDKVLIKFRTEKDKKLKSVVFKDLYGNNLWKQTKLASANKEINITKEGVYTFTLMAKGMGARDVTLDIIRKTDKLYNTAWMKYSTYTTTEVKYTVDSMIGYNEPVVTQKLIKVFDKYMYQNVKLFSFHKQILGQAGIHNSQAKGYPTGLKPELAPKNGKLKGYTYSLSSVLGGAKHWVIADIAVTTGAMFLTPATGFAAHGAMALIGPQPGNEPVQYFISSRESDIKIVREIYSPHNDARKVTNLAKDGIGEFVGLFSGDAKKAVKGTKVKSYNEGDLNFNQKGKVTNMLVYSAKPPTYKWFIMANPEYTQAKNVKLDGSAIYYAPVYKNVKAKEYTYPVKTVPLEKTTTKYTKTIRYGSIKN